MKKKAERWFLALRPCFQNTCGWGKFARQNFARYPETGLKQEALFFCSSLARESLSILTLCALFFFGFFFWGGGVGGLTLRFCCRGQILRCIRGLCQILVSVHSSNHSALTKLEDCSIFPRCKAVFDVQWIEVICIEQVVEIYIIPSVGDFLICVPHPNRLGSLYYSTEKVYHNCRAAETQMSGTLIHS